MEANKKSINDIFNGNRILEIPFFQRAYVWDEPEWDRFLIDMEDVSVKNKPYFLGSVILKQQWTNAQQSVGDKRIVIDGQQRLTTLNIFFKVLSLKTNNTNLSSMFRLRMNEKQIALLHNHNDIVAFDKVMNLTSEEKLTEEDNITKAYNHFKQRMQVNKLNYLNILTNIMFVGIDLGPEEDEQQIFDTINSLGIRLTTAELLKNYFFSREDTQLFNDYWKDVFENNTETKTFWDTEIVAGRYKRNFIDLFFYSFLQIKIQDNTLNVKTEDKIDFTKVEGLFNSYKRFIKDYKIDKLAIINEIRDYAKIFYNNFNNEVIDTELPDNSGIERINAIIFGLENTTLISFILFILKNVTDIQERNKIFDYLESYLMRRMVCRSNNKNYNQLFSDRLISNNILTFDALRTFIDNRSDKVNFMPSDNELREGFHLSRLTNKQSAGILYLIETKTRNKAAYSTSLLGLDRYSLEHIMPKKWEAHWNKLESEEDKIHRNRKILTLGNLTIITASLNSSISNGSWDVKISGTSKKPGLKQYATGLETFSKYMELPEWNEGSIEERADFLYSIAVQIWKYGQPNSESISNPISFAGYDEVESTQDAEVVKRTEEQVFSGEPELIKALQLSNKDATWWNKYFDKIKDLFTQFTIDDNSPKISLSVTKKNKMPLNIGQRYVINFSHRRDKVGLILPLEFEDILSDYPGEKEILEFYDKKGNAEALWVYFPNDILFSDDQNLFINWKLAAKAEINKTKVSSYRRFHNDFYFRAVMDADYRKRILSNL